MATKTAPGFEKNYGLMGYKTPPRTLVLNARQERNRRKACHGDWTPCNHGGTHA